MAIKAGGLKEGESELGGSSQGAMLEGSARLSSLMYPVLRGGE